MDGVIRSRAASGAVVEYSAWNENILIELRKLSEKLQSLRSSNAPATIEDIETLTNSQHHLRHLLVDSSNQRQSKDAYRNAKGFNITLDTLRVLGEKWSSKGKEAETQVHWQLLKSTLDVFATALRDHHGNSRYFTRRVEGDGWSALRGTVERLSAAVDAEEGENNVSGHERLCGYIVACAFGEESLSSVFRGVASSLGNPPANGGNPDNAESLVEQVETHIRRGFRAIEIIELPEFIPILLYLQSVQQPSLSVAVPLLVSIAAASSEHNRSCIHGTGILSRIIRTLFREEASSRSAERAVLYGLANKLVEIGINELDDAQYLYHQAATSSDAARFLLRGLQVSRNPAFIQFDLSLHGHSSIELRELGLPFPPTSTAGYTFTTWFRIDKFDPSCHTTVFGACDSTQTCFVLAYIEKDTKHFILQTSITSSRPSVRFKTTTFVEGVWYHLAVVHKRHGTVTSSRASLYVNGLFVEQVKCPYPANPPVPPSNGATADNFGAIPPLQRRFAPVQAFLGTPQDLASRMGRHMVTSKLSIASFHLFQDALSDEMVAVYQKLGPRYAGNYQDCLGSFQTYRASAELKLFNDSLHPDQNEQSEIISALHVQASKLLNESRILMSISPVAVLDDDDRNNIDESQLIKALSRHSAKILQYHTKMAGNSVVVNAAVPSVNDALSQPRGAAVLLGDPVVVVPQALDDASWRIAGCAAVGLKLVQMASTRDSILRAVQILFETIQENWKASESMERDNGFAALAGILRDKISIDVASSVPKRNGNGTMDGGEADGNSLDYELLQLILCALGYDEINVAESIIINPLAYRVLLIDYDTWRRGSLPTQKLYFRQFMHFAQSSKHHIFNVKRLTRMRIIKRILDALKGESVAEEVYPVFAEAFKILIKCHSSSENLRALALFVTYSLHDSNIVRQKTLRVKGSMARLRNESPSPANSPRGTPPRNQSPSHVSAGSQLPTKELGIRMVELYSDLLCEKNNAGDVQKFAKTVTNKWLLHLLAENDARVIVHALKILARLIVVHGQSYARKFADKTGGFTILRNRLRSWWHVPTIWAICFALMLGFDVADINFDRDFDLFSLVDTFSKSDGAVTCPEMLPVMAAMLEAGLRKIVRSQADAERASNGQDNSNGSPAFPHLKPPAAGHSRRRSMSLNSALAQGREQVGSLTENAAVLQIVVQFISDLELKSPAFRDFVMSSNFVQELLFVLYPVVVTTDPISASTELHTRNNAGLNFEGQDVAIRPNSRSSTQPNPIVRSSNVVAPPSPDTQRAAPLRRGSSFVLLSSERPQINFPSAKFRSILSPTKSSPPELNFSSSLVEGLLETVISVFIGQVFQRKEFPGFGLYLKVPPGFQEHQAYFESYVLLHAMTAISNHMQLDQQLLCEPRVITNFARYSVHMAEAVFEGWFLNGAEPLLDFVGQALEFLQRPDIARVKGVRLCVQSINTIRLVFLRITLLRLSELEGSENTQEAVTFLEKLSYWQTIIFSPENSDGYFLKLTCYLLYTKLLSSSDDVRLAAANFWRMLLVQKPRETSTIFSSPTTGGSDDLANGFLKLMEIDNEAFLDWISSHRKELDVFFFGRLSKIWDDFVADENRKTEDSARTRLAKRREKLKQWVVDEQQAETIWHRHEISSNHWRLNIFASERLKHQRAQQDQQDNLAYIATTIRKLERILHGPCALFEKEMVDKWQLDETEGRNRMRMRLLPEQKGRVNDYQPKRAGTDTLPKSKLKLDTNVGKSSRDSISATPVAQYSKDLIQSPTRARSTSQTSDSQHPDEEFEIVEDPNEGEEGFEDKNRKVMRSIQHGDKVQHVCNTARIVGLEAVEGLLIIGETTLYLLDDFFQRSDGELVRSWQAPAEERDAYLQMISGRQTTTRRPQQSDDEQVTRHWKWAEVLSISKRRFLFRDVAIEVFFTDGRSYLLTTISADVRDDLYARLVSKAPHVNNPVSMADSEDAWRLEELRNPEEAPQTFGAKFASVFNTASSNVGTRKWMRGEISNFQYLMLVNTMAGRTFNDLTQYPVFPWVLADYTSEELDLSNPRTFRDFSKPMGAQAASRESDFRERFHTFAEMGDHPPFHYGTHYSSAMVVTSYLIRIQPFVHSYLLLQGGSFDHAERLFSSIEKAWLSASKDNMTDVRELTPEFFYLPEFLTNINNYNFGTKQNSDRIDNVTLPPWAKGDPAMFIAKHREALESPYVSKRLHQWIDLIFGFKQRGEAAIEATNVFHYLSYHGAKDLDAIEDPVERLATINIIHNFGQTPHQVFQRAHPQREDPSAARFKRLDTAAEFLTRIPSALLESGERVSSLLHAPHQDRLLCSAAFRLNIPPTYERYMEWGFTDGSLRFYDTSSKKIIGLYEHVHLGQISAATFADGKTLVTAGTDCTLAVWGLQSHSKGVDLVHKVSLFGHRKTPTVLATSRTFSTFLSADTAGKVYLWDLNRLEFIREIENQERPVQCARINSVTGNIMLCCGGRLLLYTLNGRLLLDEQVCDTDDPEDVVSCCAFYEGVGNEWVTRELMLTGQRRGVANIWSKTINPEGQWSLSLVKRLDHVDTQRGDGMNHAAAITCILPRPQEVYTGDEDGRVFEWDCVQRN